MNEEEKPKLSMVERLKLQAQNQKKYGKGMEKEASLGAQDCPNCGAGRAKYKGVTNCAYCGHEFIETRLNDGIHIKSTDNSN